MGTPSLPIAILRRRSFASAARPPSARPSPPGSPAPSRPMFCRSSSAHPITRSRRAAPRDQRPDHVHRAHRRAFGRVVPERQPARRLRRLGDGLRSDVPHSRRREALQIQANRVAPARRHALQGRRRNLGNRSLRRHGRRRLLPVHREIPSHLLRQTDTKAASDYGKMSMDDRKTPCQGPATAKAAKSAKTSPRDFCSEPLCSGKRRCNPPASRGVTGGRCRHPNKTAGEVLALLAALAVA